MIVEYTSCSMGMEAIDDEYEIEITPDIQDHLVTNFSHTHV